MSEDDPRDDADARADSDSDRTAERAAAAADGGDVSRRWLIRLLVGLGVGVPVLVEARTLYHIVAGFLFGDGGDDAGTRTPTTSEPSTGIGEELLPATEPRDELSDAELRVADDGWVFHATVTVENTGDAPYTLVLGAVTTNTGTRVDGRADSGRVPVGETGTVEHEWVLPTGESPATLAVTGVVHRDDGDDRVAETVRLGKIPTRG